MRSPMPFWTLAVDVGIVEGVATVVGEVVEVVVGGDEAVEVLW